MPQSAKPDHEDVVRAIESARHRGGGYVQVNPLGTSVEGRSILCAICTDPAVAAEQKEHVLVVAGQHGSKESGRAIALELLAFLTSNDPEAAKILSKQVVAIIPCGNPDGAFYNTMRNAAQSDIARSYAFDDPAPSAEGRILETFAMEFVPDLFVDVHGRAGGGMKELDWLTPVWGFSSDRYFLTMMSASMAQAAEQAGFPQSELSPPGTLDIHDGNILYLGEKLAAHCKSLCFGMEAIEHYYRQAEWRASGLARLKRLLRYGMEDTFGLGEIGYPCSLVSGSRTYGLKAHGVTAAQRRSNRVELVQFLSKNFAVVERGEDGVDRLATMRVFSKSSEGRNPPRFALLMRIRKPCKVERVEWRNKLLAPGDVHGYRVWEDHCSLLLQANIDEPFAGPERHLTVRYDCPFFL